LRTRRNNCFACNRSQTSSQLARAIALRTLNTDFRFVPDAKITRSHEQTTVLDDLWNSAPASTHVFHYAQVPNLPEGAQRHLTHAIAVGMPLASAVRLRMHGEIKLKGWYSFSAEEVLCWGRGMIWRAAVRMHGLPIRGSDSLVYPHGAMRWKLFGIVPIVHASGPDIIRSAAGRVNIESIWLPSVLCSDAVSWTAPETSHAHAQFTAHNETAGIDYAIDEGPITVSKYATLGQSRRL